MRTILAVFLLLIPATGIAQSNDAKTRAQALLGEGLALYENGNVSGALEKFESAYSAYPSPKLHLNIGQANRDLGRLPQAMEAFERFMAEAPSANAEAKTEAQKSIVELQGKLGRLVVECDVLGASVSVDGRRAGLTPLAKPIWVTPGRHQVTVRHTSYPPAVEDVEVVPRTKRVITIALLPSVPGTSPVVRSEAPRRSELVADIGSEATPGEPVYEKKWFWPVVGGAAALTLIVIIVAASSGGGTDVPMTTLGSQRAF